MMQHGPARLVQVTPRQRWPKLTTCLQSVSNGREVLQRNMLASRQQAKQQMLPCPLTKRLAKPRMGPEPDKGYVVA